MEDCVKTQRENGTERVQDTGLGWIMTLRGNQPYQHMCVCASGMVVHMFVLVGVVYMCADVVHAHMYHMFCGARGPSGVVPRVLSRAWNFLNRVGWLASQPYGLYLFLPPQQWDYKCMFLSVD